jgi:hypothetical protein
MAASTSVHTKHSALIAHLAGKNGSQRRPIRILHNSAILPDNHEVFQQLQETNVILEERLASLKTLRSHTKQTNTTNLLKGEWTDENVRLNALRNKVENSIKTYLQLMIVNSNQLNVNTSILNTTPNNGMPGFGNIGRTTSKMMKTGLSSDVHSDGNAGVIPPESRQDVTFIINFIDSTIYEEEKLTKERVSLRSSYQNQLKEIKRIINNAHKQAIHSNPVTRPVGDQNGEKEQIDTLSDVHQQVSMIRGVIADLFLNLRCDHSKTWQNLRHQEDDLKCQLTALDKQIHEMLKTETLKKQDAFLESELIKLLKACTSLNHNAPTTMITSAAESVSPQVTPRSPRKLNSPRSKNYHKPVFEGPSISISDNGISANLDNFFVTNNDAELASVVQTDPDLAAILQSYFHQIQHVDQELSHLKEQSSMEISQLHVDLELDPGVPYGGWNQEAHENFVKIYRKATLTGMQRKKMMEVLGNALPNESRESIMAHEEYVRGMKRISSKYKQMEQTQIVKRQELMIQLSKEVQDYNEEKAEKIRYEQQLQQHEEKRMMIHERLESLRQEKLMHDEEKRMEELLNAQEEDKQQLLRLQQLEAERQERNRKLTEYREEKRKLLEQQNLQMEMERKRMADELKRLIEENRSKVEFRAHKIEEKNLQRKLKEVQ